MVNWCVALQTAVSDIEVEGEDIEEPTKIGGYGGDLDAKFNSF
jgi:valyl-tRNA synthetase